MTPDVDVPRAARPFIDFAPYLRGHGFTVSPEQSTWFLQAINLLGPKSLDDVHRAALATLPPPPERRAEYDALFHAYFGDRHIIPPTPSAADDDEMRVHDDAGGFMDQEIGEDVSDPGDTATRAEVLTGRQFGPADEAQILRRFSRLAPRRLPVRRGHRRQRVRRGDAYSLRRALREAVRRDGEILVLPETRRRQRQRKVLLLIDVSGSMKDQTDGYLRFAHALFQASDRSEVFTLGTRLTRVTRALRLRNRTQALAMAGGMVSDWDGGTRIGDALTAFLALPRYAGFARGAVVIILSDGLERGGHEAMTAAVAKLSRLAWRVSWLSPLAATDDFRPQTAALQAIEPFVGRIHAGQTLHQLCDHALNLARETPAP